MPSSVLRLALYVCAAAPGTAVGETGSVWPASRELDETVPAPRLSWDLEHPYGDKEAVARIGYLLTYWRERFGIEVRGSAEDLALGGHIIGYALAARIRFRPHHVYAILSDPGWPVRGPVGHYIEAMLRKYLNPTYAEGD